MSKHFNDKFKIPKIIREIKLAEYAPEFGETVIEVWVNPPRAMLDEVFELQRQVKELSKPAPADELNTGSSRPEGEMSPVSPPDPQPDLATMQASIESLAAKTREWYAIIWSQGKPENHWTVEEIADLVKRSRETDPTLWPWICNQTGILIRDHRMNAKKG